MSSVNTEKYKIITKVRLKFTRTSARKARYVIDSIRGKTVKEAMGILQFTHRPSAQPKVLQLLKNAVDSAKAKYEGEPEELIIGAVYANDGPQMKRLLPAPFGRAFQIRKRFCHITMILTEEL